MTLFQFATSDGMTQSPPGSAVPFTHTLKRYLVARFRGQVEPLPELGSDGGFKEVVIYLTT